MGILNVSYQTAQNLLTKVPTYYIQQGDGDYDIFIIGESDYVFCHTVSGGEKTDFETNYKASCTSVPSKDDAIVLGKVANKIPFVIPKNSQGIPLTITEPRTGDEVIISTHNLCDPVTWFTTSERIVEETLTSSDGYKWDSVSVNWVDMISGRVQGDDRLAAEQMALNPLDPHGYQVVINVDGYDKEMRTPFLTSGGDYEVFWEDGYVKSFEDWTGKTVLASYSKSINSEFTLKPLPGKVLNIEAAEADFSLDVEMLDTIEYNIYGYAAVFAPQLGLPEGTKIMIQQNKYKRLSQIVNESIGSYPIIDVYGSSEASRSLPTKEYRKTTRGMKSKTQSIPFRYATVRSMQDSLGIELRVRLSNDNAFNGDLATCTFYCTSQDEG